MKHYIPDILIAIAAGVFAIGGAYIERGCWAFGFEWAVPVVVLALLLYTKGEDQYDE